MIDPVLLRLPKAMSKLFDLFLTAFDTPPLVAISLVKKKRLPSVSVQSKTNNGLYPPVFAKKAV